MGTQQILLIVLSVIIVGAAIAVGITMFNNQAYSANKSAIAADAQSFATQVVQYYKTPASQGGAGQIGIAATDYLDVVDAEKIGQYIGWAGLTDAETPTADYTDNDSGEYVIVEPAADGKVVICGMGKEAKNSNKPAVQTTVDLVSGKITAVVMDVPAATTIDGVPALF